MQHKLFNKITILTLILMVSACATANLSYRLDPEIGNLQSLSSFAQLVSVSVIDKRPQPKRETAENTLIINGPTDEAAELRNKLIDHLKAKNFKIIANPLLADIALEIHIENLQAVVRSEFLKSEIQVDSQLRLKANKQSKTYENIYTMSRTQEVANPVNNADISGVVNRILTEQLSLIFNEPALAQLSSD
jgi:uncharacterized lipoprotein YajG